ncbi:response regulator transcription factor (plasmid) [Streptomyces sp. NBC_01717]|uniref:helix-turn-helix transcriptional regulator n=1 Tax=Streptomyces sp. NBC_01717 TaxID=2975918 RepID=UPI002E343E49|nr:response regulator transcription factor [Streptomyces sp. NBC_01717]
MRDNTTFARQQDVEGGRESAPISVALRASDAILEHGINAYLTSSPRVSVLPRGSLLEADVSVLVLNNMDDEWLKVLKHDAARTFHYPIPVVIVADAISESQLNLAIEYGMTSFLPRSQTNLDQLVDAVVEASAGHSQMPEMLVFQLVAELRQRKRKTILAEVLQDSGMSAREIEVLRMLSEGMDTGEIAARMSYSERTIKGIIHDVVKRWKLRNRTHAVAYAMRVGIL